MKQIKVTINKEGVSVEVFGVKGPGCDEVIKTFLDQIGGAVTTSEEKPEYYEAQSDSLLETDFSGN